MIACNYAEPSKVAVGGALCYVTQPNPGGGHDRMCLLIRSRGGRWIEKWERIERLTNFRVKTLPPEHPKYGDYRLWDYDAEQYAEWMRVAEALS